MDGHFPNITDPNNRNFEFKVQSFYCWIFRSPTCLKIKQKVQVPWAFFFHFFLRIRYSSVPNKHAGALINFEENVQGNSTMHIDLVLHL